LLHVLSYLVTLRNGHVSLYPAQSYRTPVSSSATFSAESPGRASRSDTRNALRLP
jgi:hypothetical protein